MNDPVTIQSGAHNGLTVAPLVKKAPAGYHLGRGVCVAPRVQAKYDPVLAFLSSPHAFVAARGRGALLVDTDIGRLLERRATLAGGAPQQEAARC